MASDYTGDDDDSWDLELLDDILKQAEEANAAKRASQAASQALSNCSMTTLVQPDTYGASNYKRQVPSSSSLQHVTGALNSGYQNNDARPSELQGRGWQRTSTLVPTTADTVTGPLYPVSQQQGLVSGMGTSQAERAVSSFASPQPTSGGTVHSRGSHHNGNLSNSQSNQHIVHENMPPPAPPPMWRQASSSGVQNLSNSGTDEETARLQEELAEKTGAVSLLKSRLSQADKEIFELKTRTGRQGNGHSGTDQARELSRLSSELLFKDQELLEARLAKSDREAQLKEALATAARLREELEAVKQQNQEAANEVVKQVADEVGHEIWDPVTAHEVSLPQQQELRSANITVEALNIEAAEHENVLKQPSSGLGSKAKPVDLAGGVSVKCKEKSDEGIKEGVPPTSSYSETQNRSNVLHKLEHIWGLDGADEDSVAIVSKLFGVCGEQMYNLLNVSPSEQETKDQKNVGNQDSDPSFRKRKCANVEQPVDHVAGPSQRLHNALSEVAIRRALPTSLLAHLLGFCSMAIEELVFSALRTVRHLLVWDASCRNAVLERKGVPALGSAAPCSSDSRTPGASLEPAFGFGRKGWAIMRSRPTGDGNKVRTEAGSYPVFASSRISIRVEGAEAVKYNSGEQSKGAQPQEKPLTDADILSSQNPFAAWILDFSSKSTSVRVQTECAYIVYLLIAHSVPSSRIQFAFMLFNGSLAGLLQLRAPEVQSCAVKVVQLLLSCLPIQKAFWSSESHDDVEDMEGGERKDLAGAEDMQMDGGGDEKVEGGRERSDNKEGATRKVDCVLDIVRGLSACLTYTGSSMEEYALRRRALRVLSFLAFSGESGAATLIRKPAESSSSSPVSGKQDPGDERKQADGGAAAKATGSTSSATLRRSSRRSQKKEAEEGPGGLTPEEQKSSVAVQLVCMIASELDAEEEEDRGTGPTKEIAEQRTSVWKDGVSLLCRLTALPTIAPAVLSSLMLTPPILRLSLGVTQRLISRAYVPHFFGSSKALTEYSSIVESAELLNKRILANTLTFEESQPSLAAMH